jgi:hypothetical protein
MQLHDLLELVRGGSFHHATGIAAIVRKLIAKGIPLALLQLAAATIDAPLIIFTNAQPRYQYEDVPTPTNLIRLNARASPVMLMRNPIDLDVWLDTSSSVIAGELVTNRFLLKKVGDTVASHFDVDVHPVVPALRAASSSTSVGNVDFFIQLICSVGEIAANLGLQVLEAGTD